jgi:hypothetical protein
LPFIKQIVTLIRTCFRGRISIPSAKNDAMMKRMIILVFLTIVLSGISTVQSQELSVNEEIIYINSLLKANPYRDTFLEITFYYSISVTPDKELLVNMDFDGPFKTSLKARISELGRSFLRDTAYEGNSSVCWHCKSADDLKENVCVYNETITSENEKESHYSDNICVMFSREGDIRARLIEAFDKLFRMVLEQ